MKKKLLGVYDYTVVLTYAGMLFAFCGILQAINLRFSDAVLCIMLAGVCDMFDGAVASTKKNRTFQEKRFGIQIDSLSDLISFGALPAIFSYMICDKNPVVGAVAAFYVLCALIRLSYFNVLEEERQQQTTEKRQSYLGVPVTTIAIFLPACYLLYDNKILKNPFSFVVLITLTAIGFILPINIKKPKFIGKIVMIVLGIVEMLGLIFFVSWGAV